jgi:hypothetical protein
LISRTRDLAWTFALQLIVELEGNRPKVIQDPETISSAPTRSTSRSGHLPGNVDANHASRIVAQMLGHLLRPAQ